MCTYTEMNEIFASFFFYGTLGLELGQNASSSANPLGINTRHAHPPKHKVPCIKTLFNTYRNIFKVSCIKNFQPISAHF